MKKRILTLFVVVMMVFSLAACGSKSGSIIGKWKNDQVGITFDFKEGDAVTMSVAGMSVEGTYKTDGDKISLKIASMGTTVLDEEGTYKVNGDTLTITIQGDPLDLTKVKE